MNWLRNVFGDTAAKSVMGDRRRRRLLKSAREVEVCEVRIMPSVTAANDSLQASHDYYGSSNLVANDSNGDPSSIEIISGPSHGSVDVDGDGVATYYATTPALYVGSDSFTYRIWDWDHTQSATATLAVSITNTAPVGHDDTLATEFETPITFGSELTDNDTDIDWADQYAGFTIISATSGTGGTAVRNSNGTVTFTPDEDFVGEATFTYTFQDSIGATGTATATVNVADQVWNVTDQPTTIPRVNGQIRIKFEGTAPKDNLGKIRRTYYVNGVKTFRNVDMEWRGFSKTKWKVDQSFGSIPAGNVDWEILDSNGNVVATQSGSFTAQ